MSVSIGYIYSVKDTKTNCSNGYCIDMAPYDLCSKMCLTYRDMYNYTDIWISAHKKYIGTSSIKWHKGETE